MSKVIISTLFLIGEGSEVIANSLSGDSSFIKDLMIEGRWCPYNLVECSPFVIKQIWL